MHNLILLPTTLARRSVHLLSGNPIGNVQRRPLSLNYRVTVAIAALVVFTATACGNGQAPLPEPVQTPVAEPESIQAPAAEPDQTLSSEPEAVVSALLDAMAVNDAEQIRSLFDKNASQAYGDGTPRSGEAFFSWLESDIIQREGRVEDAQLTANGNEVVVTGQYQSRGYTSEADFLLTVENGRIISWQMRY